MKIEDQLWRKSFIQDIKFIRKVACLETLSKLTNSYGLLKLQYYLNLSSFCYIEDNLALILINYCFHNFYRHIICKIKGQKGYNEALKTINYLNKAENIEW